MLSGMDNVLQFKGKWTCMSICNINYLKNHKRVVTVTIPRKEFGCLGLKTGDLL